MRLNLIFKCIFLSILSYNYSFPESLYSDVVENLQEEFEFESLAEDGKSESGFSESKQSEPNPSESRRPEPPSSELGFYESERPESGSSESGLSKPSTYEQNLSKQNLKNKTSFDDSQINTTGKHFNKCKVQINLLNKITLKPNIMILTSKNPIEEFDNMQLKLDGCYKKDSYYYAKLMIQRKFITKNKVQDMIPIFHGWMMVQNPIFSLITHEKYEFFLNKVTISDV